MKTISAKELNAELLKRKYARLLKNEEIYPSQNNWDYIIEHKMYELSHLLYQKYLSALDIAEEKRKSNHNDTITMFPKYLQSIERNHAIETLYNDTSSNTEATVELAIRLDLFDFDGILNMIDRNEAGAAAQMLMALKPSYSANDIEDLNDLLEEFYRLPNLGRIDESALNLFLGERKYICPNGHTNNDVVEFCPHEDCELNIKGLTRYEVDCIDEFAERIKILEELLFPKSASEEQ